MRLHSQEGRHRQVDQGFFLRETIATRGVPALSLLASGRLGDALFLGYVGALVLGAARQELGDLVPVRGGKRRYVNPCSNKPKS